ncbi:hypothetical protein [Flavobacterium oreochromis]|uniref:Roadblock/LAMTOR2 domain-containing protein n=1 Tax=Flavobacterium columnare TaxID=996 RepID=A0A246G7J2_9FLAO|nr:hypothetical protein [Flavobacterium oreochromis]OWP74496.1 hypothetical protein BWK62_14170 [Flavobacterium oreochromis]
MSDFLQQFGEDLKSNVPGFIAVAIAEIKSGISYYTLSTNPDFDPELASVFNLEVVKAKLNAINSLDIKDHIENIIINLNNITDILYISENNEFFICLTIDSKKVDLNRTKILLNKYKKDITKKI